MPSTAFTTTLIETVSRVGDVSSFRFERPAGYEYEAGQWHVLSISGARETVVSHFTHSSSPTEPYLELTTHVRDSDFKKALAGLSPGDEVEMEGPYGSFSLNDGHEPVVFITGGIGITPVRSILRSVLDTGVKRRLFVVYANTSDLAIVFADELAEMERLISTLHVVHVISRPSAVWQGHRGHVDAELLVHELPDPLACRYYLCGPPSLVASMNEMVLEIGAKQANIVKESFDGYE